MFCGVISTYCTPKEARAASICKRKRNQAGYRQHPVVAITYHHSHRDLSIDRIHKNIELIQAPDRAAYRFP